MCLCRVVVVSNYTKTLDLLQDLCVHMGYTFCRLDGHTPTSQRQRLVDGFNSSYSQNFLFLLSSKAGGVGLNLVGASHLVLYDIDWNPANDIQVRRTHSQTCLLSCVHTHTRDAFTPNLSGSVQTNCGAFSCGVRFVWASAKAVN